MALSNNDSVAGWFLLHIKNSSGSVQKSWHSMNNKTCFQAEKEVQTLLSMNLISGKVKNISRAYLRWIKLQKISSVNMSRLVLIHGLLICTLISENQGLEKLRSVSNLRKI